ncbi:MAG: tetratricopeptide repeat protein [Myxococcales bacterium]|nr:tetratricopeptide repeat protein [Myxococcales bacterium]
MLRAGLALLTLVGLAHAQSKRYPAAPVDKDQEKADKSALWESATNPNQLPYRNLIAQAKQSIEMRSAPGLADAVAVLGDAIKLMPREAEAYRWRGEAHFWLNHWADCAADLKQAAQLARRAETDKKSATELQLRLGNCQARGGKLAEAERTLAEAAAAGTSTGEVLMRLGEVRIAMGKLDEAIAALTAALEVPDVQQAQTRFLLASAYDRARRPAEAVAEVRSAVRYDGQLTLLDNPSLPFLGAGEKSYLLGLGWSAKEPPRAEYALIYFRQYLKEAPDSQWRKRAEEHLRELAGSKLPESIDRVAGGAALDLDATTALVRKGMPAMRACLAKLPTTVIDVRVTRSGPRSPTPPAVSPARGGYMYRPRAPMVPPDGATIKVDKNADAFSRAEADAAVRCIEPLIGKLGLPAVKEKDQYWQIAFRVVGS